MPNVILEESGSPAPFGTPYPGATAGAAVAANIANSMANAKKAVAEAKMRQALAEAVGRGELVEQNGQLYETGKQPSAQRQAAPPAVQAPQGVQMPSLDWRSGFPAGQNTADVAMRGLEEAANIRGMTVGELVRDQRRQAQLQKQAQDAAQATRDRFTGGPSLDLPGLAWDAYQTDVPYVSDILRNVIENMQKVRAKQPGPTNVGGVPLGFGAPKGAIQASEMAVPVSAGDIALTLAFGIGNEPTLAGAGLKGAKRIPAVA